MKQANQPNIRINWLKTKEFFKWHSHLSAKISPPHIKRHQAKKISEKSKWGNKKKKPK